MNVKMNAENRQMVLTGHPCDDKIYKMAIAKYYCSIAVFFI